MLQTSLQATTQPIAHKSGLSLGYVDPFNLDAHADILNFIQTYVESLENADGAIRGRPLTHYRQAFATGLVVHGHRDGRTTFVQLLYPQPGKGQLYVELGTVLNRDQRRGLMEPVVRAVIQRVLAIWPMATLYAVAKPGTASAYVLRKVGMCAVDPAPELLALRENMDMQLSPHKAVYAIRLIH